MRQAGCSTVALSGAGPAQYALFVDDGQARATEKRLCDRVGPDVTVHLTRFRQQPLHSITDDHETSHVDHTQSDASRARP
jgi:hypothetical protein